MKRNEMSSDGPVMVDIKVKNGENRDAPKDRQGLVVASGVASTVYTVLVQCIRMYTLQIITLHRLQTCDIKYGTKNVSRQVHSIILVHY